MKFSTLMIIKAVVCVVLGPLLVLIPGPFFSLFGVTLDAAGTMPAREYGAALVGTFLLTWFARNTTESDARRAIILALFVYDAIGFVVTLLVGLAGGLNLLGWSIPLIYLFFTIGFGYFAIWGASAPKKISTLPAHP
jgi:hypothetical protein